MTRTLLIGLAAVALLEARPTSAGEAPGRGGFVRGAPPSRAPVTRPERYRSGRNGGASKASCRVTGTWVRIPPSPPLLNNRKTPLATAPVSALLGLSPVVLLRGLRRIDVRGSNVKACVLHASPYKTRATH